MARQPEPLSPDDAAILALESPAIAGHTLKVLILAPAEQPLAVESLRAGIEPRLAAEPRARQRVELPDGRVESARWVEDEHFDLRAHVRARDDDAGLDESGLWRVAGELMARRLDHERPLWALDLVGPLADGRQAIVARIHHAMADGISSVRFLDELLWDREPEPAGERPAAARREPAPAARRSRWREARRLPGAVRRELGGHAPRTLLDRPIGPRRALASSVASLAELKEIGASRPGHVTVNDVLLAVLAGGLREWLAGAGERAAAIRAQVPVSLHHRDEAEIGNRDSFLNVDLPLAEPDPIARLERINAETAKRKRLGDAEELYDLFHALGRLGPVGRAAQRLAASPREFSLSISNVPGPREPVSVAGRRVERLCSAAEPADRHALRVSAISCAGTIGIGLCADPEAVSGVEALGTAIDASLAELRTAALGSPGPSAGAIG